MTKKPMSNAEKQAAFRNRAKGRLKEIEQLCVEMLEAFDAGQDRAQTLKISRILELARRG